MDSRIHPFFFCTKMPLYWAVQVDPSHCHYQIDLMQGLPLQWETLVPLLPLDNKVGVMNMMNFSGKSTCFFGNFRFWQLGWLHFSIHVKNILRHCSHGRLCNYMGGSCLWWKFFACGCTLEEPSLSDMLQWMGSLDAAGWIWGVRWVSLPANQGLHRF